jgi:hypothetical protein
MFTSSLSKLRQSASYFGLEHRGPAKDDPIESRLEAPAARPTNRFGLNANMILFEDSKKYTDPTYPDKFPNQKIPIEELLYNEDPELNPLMKPCPPNRIRYFHLPANNMSWVEVGRGRRVVLQQHLLTRSFRKPSPVIIMKRCQNMMASFDNQSTHRRHT